MSNRRASNTFDKLKRSAQSRWKDSHSGKTRVTVQVGHCSKAVGASEVADALADSLPQNAYLVIAGCDGACFDAPQVVVTDPLGELRQFARVTPESAKQIATDLCSRARWSWTTRVDSIILRRAAARSRSTCAAELDSTDHRRLRPPRRL